MRSNSLALATSQNRRQHESSHDEDDYNHNRPYVISSPLEEGGSTYAPWRLFEERVRTGPYGLSSFPSQPYSPIRILIFNPGNQERANSRLRQFIQGSPPRIRREWHQEFTNHDPENTNLTNEDFKKVMKKLKRETFNPTYPKKRSGLSCIFNAKSNKSNIRKNEEKNEGKCCAICLEDFVLNESVLVTPCNHMFHNDCLVPWLKSHGKCPVCRFVLCEKSERELAVNNNNGQVATDYISDLEIVSLIRAMDEALNWVNVAR